MQRVFRVNTEKAINYAPCNTLTFYLIENPYVAITAVIGRVSFSAEFETAEI